MRTDLLPSILISEFYIQLASSFHMKCTVCRNNILLGELQFFTRLHSVYMHPDYLQSTSPRVYKLNPQETFFLENMHILQEGTRAIFCSTEQEFYQQKSKCYRHLMGQFKFYVYRNYILQ